MSIQEAAPAPPGFTVSDACCCLRSAAFSQERMWLSPKVLNLLLKCCCSQRTAVHLPPLPNRCAMLSANFLSHSLHCFSLGNGEARSCTCTCPFQPTSNLSICILAAACPIQQLSLPLLLLCLRSADARSHAPDGWAAARAAAEPTPQASL